MKCLALHCSCNCMCLTLDKCRSFVLWLDKSRQGSRQSGSILNWIAMFHCSPFFSLTGPKQHPRRLYLSCLLLESYVCYFFVASILGSFFWDGLVADDVPRPSSSLVKTKLLLTTTAACDGGKWAERKEQTMLRLWLESKCDYYRQSGPQKKSEALETIDSIGRTIATNLYFLLG